MGWGGEPIMYPADLFLSYHAPQKIKWRILHGRAAMNKFLFEW